MDWEKLLNIHRTPEQSLGTAITAARINQGVKKEELACFLQVDAKELTKLEAGIFENKVLYARVKKYLKLP